MNNTLSFNLYLKLKDCKKILSSYSLKILITNIIYFYKKQTNLYSPIKLLNYVYSLYTCTTMGANISKQVVET